VAGGGPAGGGGVGGGGGAGGPGGFCANALLALGLLQQLGTAGNLGVWNEQVSAVEFALDLQRIVARNDISGQVGGPVQTGTREGIVLINSSGMVSYVPEPSTGLLGLLAAGALIIRRRRSA